MIGSVNPDHTQHDRQDIIVEGPITTTSTTFVDIPGAQLITGDLGEPGNYQIELSMSVQQSNNNTSISFRAVIDGVPGEGRSVFFGPGSSNEPQHATLIGQANSMASGTTFKIQWSVSGGEGQINGLRLMIDGVPVERVIFVPSPGVDSYLKGDGFSYLKGDGGFYLLGDQP